MSIQINHITVCSEKIERPLTLALVCDLHNGEYAQALPAMQGADAILIVGDLINRHRKGYAKAVDFLRDAPEIAPTYYALGNHERKFKELAEYWPHVEKSRVTVLDNTWIPFKGIVLGALSSGAVVGVNAGFLPDMAAQQGYKLLMCHHPEMYSRYVSPFDIDLTVAGHAHGGQVRLGAQGLYAPGQGILPRLTSGFYFENRLLVSRGMTNSTFAPRINNACELILLHLTGENSP